MIKLPGIVTSWYDKKKLEQKIEHFGRGKPPIKTLSWGLGWDDQELIDYALEMLISEGSPSLADDQETLLELISTCSQFSSPKNLEMLISFWTFEYKGRHQYLSCPIHAVLRNNRYSKVELWNVLFRIFAVDHPTIDGITALADASSLGSLEDIETLIQFGANSLPNFNDQFNIGFDPLSFALFFNDERDIFQKLLQLAKNGRYSEAELLNLLLFNVCAFHGGEYDATKRLSDMEQLVSLGARFDYQPANQNNIGLLSLESTVFEGVLDSVFKISAESGFHLADNPSVVVSFLERGKWKNRPHIINSLSNHGVNFNDGYENHSEDNLEPIWFGILNFYDFQSDDWMDVAKCLIECGVSLELRDSRGRSFCHRLRAKTKSDRYNVLNNLRTLGLSDELYLVDLKKVETM